MPDVTINGKPLASLSAYVYDTPDLRRAPPQQFAQIPLYRRTGVAVGPSSIAARSIKLAGRIVTTANTVAARAAAEHTLKDHCGNGGLLTVTVDEGTSPDMMIDALLEGLDISPRGHPLQAVVSDFTLALLAPDAVWRDAAGHIVVSVAATATRYNLPLGTAPVAPKLTILGAATTPTVTIRDAGGAAQVTLVFGTLTSSETLEVDCEAGTIVKYSSGAATNGMSLLTSGTFPFRLDPAWGDYASSRWPTIETSAGQAEVLYAKRYW